MSNLATCQTMDSLTNSSHKAGYRLSLKSLKRPCLTGNTKNTRSNGNSGYKKSPALQRSHHSSRLSFRTVFVKICYLRFCLESQIRITTLRNGKLSKRRLSNSTTRFWLKFLPTLILLKLGWQLLKQAFWIEFLRDSALYLTKREELEMMTHLRPRMKSSKTRAKMRSLRTLERFHY